MNMLCFEGHLAEACIEDDCYFVTSQLADSAGLGEEECRRHYASATMFEPRDQTHWDVVSEWYQQLSFEGTLCLSVCDRLANHFVALCYNPTLVILLILTLLLNTSGFPIALTI